MHPFRKFCFAVSLFAIPALAPVPVHAAQSYDGCAGFIDSVPTTISTQGTWCLRGNVATAITSGAAITIATNNVTIDCNDFKIGGLAAGDASTAIGIHADNRHNATVRHCNIRGFFRGIDLAGTEGSGHVVEDNRLDNSLYVAIRAEGVNNLVQRNRVYDTGGTIGSSSTGINASGDVIGNIVSGVFATTADTYPRGILITGDGSRASDNNVRGLVVSGAGTAIGIDVQGYGSTTRDNHVSAAAAIQGTGIRGWSNTDTFCGDNTIAKFATAIASCQDAGGNVSN